MVFVAREPSAGRLGAWVCGVSFVSRPAAAHALVCAPACRVPAQWVPRTSLQTSLVFGTPRKKGPKLVSKVVETNGVGENVVYFKNLDSGEKMEVSLDHLGRSILPQPLFQPDSNGYISVDELRSVMQSTEGDMPLNDEEFAEMLQMMGLREGGRVRLKTLRNHECWRTLGGIFHEHGGATATC